MTARKKTPSRRSPESRRRCRRKRWFFTQKAVKSKTIRLPVFSKQSISPKQSDVAIVFVGETHDMVGEAASRASLDLPGRQMELVQAIHATGKPTIVVLVNGRPLSIGWIVNNNPAILESWMGGSQSGNAIADILFGDVNPGAKLPVTFPRTVGQVPIYYNHMNTGRPPEAENRYTSKYYDLPWTPLYPFGYGLSYTTFKLSNLQLSSSRINASGKVTVSVEVENTGRRAGDEVVQLYVRDLVATMTRPVKELKGFQRITLQPGEKRKVEFVLGPEHLGILEPGDALRRRTRRVPRDGWRKFSRRHSTQNSK